jgi:peptidoglycan hydrolase-like protein with peptidoglycan-binding domain
VALIGAAVARRPREFVWALMATVATGWIFTNALFLQTGPHPAPIFAAPKPAVQTAAPLPSPPPGRPQTTQPERLRAQPVSTRPAEPVRPNDPIAALLAPKPKLLAVQQALADFAYGPVVPTGVFDPQTRAAIERFQKARGLTVDGQLGERTLRELSTVAGRSFE